MQVSDIIRHLKIPLHRKQAVYKLIRSVIYLRMHNAIWISGEGGIRCDDGGGKDRCRMRKVFPIEGNEFEGNLLKAGPGLSRSNGELMGSRGPADKVAPGRAGSWKTETGSAGICITKRAINKVLRCRGHRQKSVSSFQARSCNLPLPPVRLLPPHPPPRSTDVLRQRYKPSQRGGEGWPGRVV